MANHQSHRKRLTHLNLLESGENRDGSLATNSVLEVSRIFLRQQLPTVGLQGYFVHESRHSHVRWCLSFLRNEELKNVSTSDAQPVLVTRRANSTSGMSLLNLRNNQSRHHKQSVLRRNTNTKFGSLCIRLLSLAHWFLQPHLQTLAARTGLAHSQCGFHGDTCPSWACGCTPTLKTLTISLKVRFGCLFVPCSFFIILSCVLLLDIFLPTLLIVVPVHIIICQSL